MVPPELVLSLLLGSIYGLVFFLVGRDRQRTLWYYWLVGAVGFVVGQFLAEYVSFSQFTIGDVHIVEGSVVSLACLLVASQVKV